MTKTQEKYRLLLYKVSYYLTLLMVFCIPFYKKMMPYLIGIWIVCWISATLLSHFHRESFNNKILLLPVLFYLFHILGMIWTTKYWSGVFDLEVKFSILLFPLAFIFLTPIYKNKLKEILFAFIAGNLIVSLFCLCRAAVLYFVYSKPSFFYNELSFFGHPSYFSMYLTFCIIILYYMITRKFGNFNYYTKIIFIALILYFCIFIFLLSSRAGIICAFMVLFLMITIDIIRNRKLLPSIVWLLISIGLFIIALKYNSRLQDAEKIMGTNGKSFYSNKETTESIGVRYLIWQTAFDIFKENLIIGVGTGDVKAVLLKNYKILGMTGAYGNKLNVHNQFFESFFGLGIPGGLLLILVFLVPFIMAIRKRNFIMIFFLLTTGFNFLIESMLNTQAGVVFFSFFLCLLISAPYDNIITINKKTETI